ncbi:hypothetical protein DWQ65_12160 [Treponema phagedenis]|uniref:Uncharacterized protein n=1 Tax=Treponema phagedenis TaxID=162 RepID=A0AAE6IUI3_TREPH|nr:hypothetical protein FUT79_10900 [Treponema phagedenis]QEJ98589.1 hypothetical protein FUT82_11670 [Treponema phagedenis]QEK01522.1 hypothetical protein FUT84_10390 [Treponema phagedenis]QEK04094.1 hypothetical protein FUT83_09965 [Treponema phagedenis]QEK06542.1 hypothetical protein FUT80_07320 [Treponema phagedenis]
MAPLTLRLFLRYFRRAKRIRLRTFEKVLAAPPIPHAQALCCITGFVSLPFKNTASDNPRNLHRADQAQSCE